jgi:hypothetical protein
MAAPIYFARWGGETGLEQYILRATGCKPYSGAGINPRIQQRTTILKSVDNTYYYADNLEDIQNAKYTLFGHNGDQSESEPKFNEPLLNPEKTEHIYLYRVIPGEKRSEYLWYGKYEMVGKETMQHVGKDGELRNIIVLSLQRTTM